MKTWATASAPSNLPRTASRKGTLWRISSSGPPSWASSLTQVSSPAECRNLRKENNRDFNTNSKNKKGRFAPVKNHHHPRPTTQSRRQSTGGAADRQSALREQSQDGIA